MSITDRVQLDPSPNADAVLAYLTAQGNADFTGHATFLHPDCVFNGLVLQARGANVIAEEMNRFLPSVKTLAVDAAVRAEAGEVERFLILYRFQLIGQPEAQALCDHVTAQNGRIVRVDNVFDVSRMPQPPKEA